MDEDLSSRTRPIWSKSAIENGGSSKTHTYTFTANLSDFAETMYVCYSAHGNFGDTWYRQNITLNMSLS